ncbi:DUF1763-domain-containing protein [Wilcoxina mikolae CBS 423.85]|nr:DUF1763-domain-containing protein [Wilcoxina mikolae CBS 423.85]
MSTPSPQTLRLTYRQLYKVALAAVQYTVPARYTVRDKLRTAFRSTPASHYNERRISNTLDFLHTAAKKRGLEHKLVKNLCMVHYYQLSYRKKRQIGKTGGVPPNAYNSYLENLGLLNESMDLDLR